MKAAAVTSPGSNVLPTGARNKRNRLTSSDVLCSHVVVLWSYLRLFMYAPPHLFAYISSVRSLRGKVMATPAFILDPRDHPSPLSSIGTVISVFIVFFLFL